MYKKGNMQSRFHLQRAYSGITESSTDPPAVPSANLLVGDALGKRRPVGRWVGGTFSDSQHTVCDAEVCELQLLGWVNLQAGGS